MFEADYARETLKNGLALEAELGVSPFRFGLAGGTDAHTGTATTDENNFFGRFPASEPSAERWNGNAFDFDGRTIKGWALGALGRAGVRAAAHPLEAIWDAMKRREVHATTGSRILLRLFGGWDFAPEAAIPPPRRTASDTATTASRSRPRSP